MLSLHAAFLPIFLVSVIVVVKCPLRSLLGIFAL